MTKDARCTSMGKTTPLYEKLRRQQFGIFTILCRKGLNLAGENPSCELEEGSGRLLDLRSHPVIAKVNSRCLMTDRKLRDGSFYCTQDN